MINKKLAQNINQMAYLEQKLRKETVKTGFYKTLANLDRKNTATMKKIVEKYGWPTIKKVGKKASFNAWLLVQHTDHDLDFQKKCLLLMEKESNNNPKNIIKKNIAYLTDRILAHEGKKQIYGTQFYKNKKGKLISRPIKNKKELESLRKSVGLKSFSEYKEKMSKKSI